MNQPNRMSLRNHRASITKPTIDRAPRRMFDFTTRAIPLYGKPQINQTPKWDDRFNHVVSQNGSGNRVLLQLHRTMSKFNDYTFRFC